MSEDIFQPKSDLHLRKTEEKKVHYPNSKNANHPVAVQLNVNQDKALFINLSSKLIEKST